MKKTKRFLICILMAAIVSCLLVGCSFGDSVSGISLKNYDPESPIEMEAGAMDYEAYTLVVSYASGRKQEMKLTDEMISGADLLKSYQVGEHEITVSYGGKKCSFKISVKRESLESLYLPENPVYTYNGSAHTVEVQGNLPAEAVVTYPGGNSFVNAGTYDVSAIVSCEGYATVRLSTTVKIERARYDMSGVSLEDKEVVFDGMEHSLVLSGTLPAGAPTPTYTINGSRGSSAVYAGEYKVKVQFSVVDPNYEPIPDMEAVLNITPADYVVKGVSLVFRNENGTVISGNKKVYDGTGVTFALSDETKLPSKVSASFRVLDKNGAQISVSNKNTNIKNAGAYTVMVDLTLSDNRNYKPIEPIAFPFEVLKKDYPKLGGIEFTPAEFTFNYSEHSIAIEGTLPEGVSVSYEYYLGDTRMEDGEGKPLQGVKNAGRYTVKAVFTHTDENCKAIEPLSAVMLVKQATFSPMDDIDFGGETITYDGTKKGLSVNSQIPEGIEVRFEYYLNGTLQTNTDGSPADGVVSAGTYTVRAYFTITNNNYLPVDMIEYIFMIRKVDIDISGADLTGEKEYIYNAAAQGPSVLGATVPLGIGFTKTVYSVDADEIRTEVTEAKDCGNYVAVFVFAPEDTVNYQLAGRSTLEFEFSILPQSIDVGVIGLDPAPLIYSEGAPLCPDLVNVPEHVLFSASLYSADGQWPITQAINAGRYCLKISLSAESTNYVLTSHALSFIFEIRPKPIELFALSFDKTKFEYARFEGQHPVLVGLPAHVISTPTLYSEQGEVLQETKFVGNYRCVITLSVDSANYVLSGETEYSTMFEITKKIVNLDLLNFGTMKAPLEYDHGGSGVQYEYFESLDFEEYGKFIFCTHDNYRLWHKFSPDQIGWDGVASGIPDTAGYYWFEYQFQVEDPSNVVMIYKGEEYTSVMVNHFFVVRYIKGEVDINGAMLNSAEEYTYNGEAQAPTVRAGTLSDKVKAALQLYSVDAQGNRTQISEAKNCGNYVAVFVFDAKDPLYYRFVGPNTIEHAFSIVAHTVDLSSATIDTDTFTYSGSAQRPSLVVDLPAYVHAEVLLYTADGSEPIAEAIGAGSYRIEARFSSDDENCVIENGTQVFEFEILPITIALSAFFFDKTTFVFNISAAQHPVLVGLPAHVTATVKLFAKDGSEIEEARGAGEYSVQILLSPENANYVLSGETEYSTDFVIEKMVIDLDAIGFGTMGSPIELAYTGSSLHQEYFDSLDYEEVRKYVNCTVYDFTIAEYRYGEWVLLSGYSAVYVGSYKANYELSVIDKNNTVLLVGGVEYESYSMVHYFNIV